MKVFCDSVHISAEDPTSAQTNSTQGAATSTAGAEGSVTSTPGAQGGATSTGTKRTKSAAHRGSCKQQ